MSSSSFCPAADRCLPDSATLVWSLTRPARSALHERYLAGTCRGPAPFGHEDLAARRPRQACENVGCVDLFMDVWISGHAAMHARFRDIDGAIPDGALGYLATCVRSRLSELNRQQRVARGGIAKPQRRDGIVGRIAMCFEDPWLADLFRFLLGYAASAGCAADGWPVDVLTQRKNAWDMGDRAVGGIAARAELRADVESCLAAIRQEAGDGWLYDSILLPLANRAGRAALPVDMADSLPYIGADDEAQLDQTAAVLRDMLRRTQTGISAGTALRTAVDAWLADGACPAEWARKRADDLALRRLAKSLIADLYRDREAA
jgi:hypothetical protein